MSSEQQGGGDGGLYVCDFDRLLHLRDTDGDGKADTREAVFSGFGLTNVQGLLNSFNWGLDNQIHGATSSSGARVPQMLTKNSVRFTFLVNSETETTVLLADGETVHNAFFDRGFVP